MTNLETKDQDDFDLPPAARLLGVDATGTEHYLDATTQTVYAYQGDVVVATDVSGCPVQAYVDHFADARSWDDLRYDDRPFDEWLLDALDLATPRQEAV